MKKSLALHAAIWNGIEAYYHDQVPVLCKHALHDFFDFLKDTPDITITLSTEETKNSYEVTMQESFGHMQIHYETEWHPIVMFFAAKELLHELSEQWNVKTLFVTLEY